MTFSCPVTEPLVALSHTSIHQVQPVHKVRAEVHHANDVHQRQEEARITAFKVAPEANQVILDTDAGLTETSAVSLLPKLHLFAGFRPDTAEAFCVFEARGPWKQLVVWEDLACAGRPWTL